MSFFLHSEDEKEEKTRERSKQKATVKSLRGTCVCILYVYSKAYMYNIHVIVFPLDILVQLNDLLLQELIPRGVSMNYPSMSSLALHRNSIATSVEKLKRNKVSYSVLVCSDVVSCILL